MARFSASDAAFEGLRLVRERPVAYLIWAVLTFAFALLTAVALVTIAGDALMEFTRLMEAGGEPDPQQVMNAASRMAPLNGVTLPLGLAFYAVMYGAVNRAVLRPQEGGPGFLKLSVQELRQLGVLLLVWLIVYGVLIGGLILVLILMGVLAAAGAEAAAGIVGLIAMIAVLCATLFAGVRLSLATAMAFDRQRIDIPGAWRLTKGRFWSLFGAYLLATMLILIVWIAVFLIFAAVAAVAGGGISALGTALRPDTSSLGAYFTPTMFLYQAFIALVSALTVATFAGAPADAYRQLTSRDEATMERVIAAG